MREPHKHLQRLSVHERGPRAWLCQPAEQDHRDCGCADAFTCSGHVHATTAVATPEASTTAHCSLVAGHWSLVTGHWSLVTGVTGHWSRVTAESLFTAHCSLLAGRWSLVTGHWSHWSLVTGHSGIVNPGVCDFAP